MTQTGDNAGAQASPQPIARPTPPTRRSRAPWLALGLAVAVAAMATVWQRWANLEPAPAEAAHPAQTKPPPPTPVEEPAHLQPPPTAPTPPAPVPAPSVNEGERKAYREFRMRLDVSASDDDRDPLTYQWVQTGGPAVKLQGADKPHAWFVPKEPGRYVFEIRVGDGTNTTAAQIVRTVKESDLAGPSPGKD